MSSPRPRAARLAAALACAALAAGCASLPRPELPRAVPSQWESAGAVPAAPVADLSGWWHDFADPQLDALVREALAGNLDLAQAASRVKQARLLAGADEARWQPAVGAFIRPVRDVQAVDSYLHAGLEASWEPGLFGAAQATAQAGQARAEAARWAEQGARVALVADVVRRYLELRAAQRQAALWERIAQVEARSGALLEVRVRTRLSPPADRAQAVLRQAQAQAMAVAQRQAAAQATRALAVLAGRTSPEAAWLADTGIQPALPERALPLLPAGLLRTRPDILAAEASVAKAAAEVGMAQSELYPRLALTSGLIVSYNLTHNRRLASDAVFSLGPVLDLPLFDGGRRQLRADASDEALREALLAYRKAVVDAVNEVESALGQAAAQGERAALLARAAQAVQAQLQRQEVLRTSGLASEYDALAGERALLQAELDLAEARAAQALARVGLYRALGGAPLPEAQSRVEAAR